MTPEEFEQKLQQVKPIAFALEQEPQLSEEEVVAFEDRLGARVPQAFRWFQLHHGAGEFGSGEIWSLRQDSPFSIDRQLERTWPGTRPPDTFLPISDDGFGNLYGFQREGSGFHSDVALCELGSFEVVRGQYPSFFEFVWDAFLARFAGLR